MRHLAAAIAVAVFLGGAAPACAKNPFGGPISGMELKSYCDSKASDSAALFCLGYLNGFFEGYVVGQESTQSGYVVCPQMIVSGQVRLIVLKAMKEHPELLNQGAGLIVTKALIDFYRCSPGETPKYGQKPD